MEEESKPIHTGKKWNNESYHTSFDKADAIRKKLIGIWVDNPVYEGMQVKVKYMSSKDMFAVKTRRHPDFDPKERKKETKKNGKGKRRNKKNTDRTKFDSTSGI